MMTDKEIEALNQRLNRLSDDPSFKEFARRLEREAVVAAAEKAGVFSAPLHSSMPGDLMEEKGSPYSYIVGRRDFRAFKASVVREWDAIQRVN